MEPPKIKFNNEKNVSFSNYNSVTKLLRYEINSVETHLKYKCLGLETSQ